MIVAAVLIWAAVAALLGIVIADRRRQHHAPARRGQHEKRR